MYDSHSFNFTAATPRHRNHIKRGNVVKVAGKRKPMIVLEANWKKGVKVREYDGRINSRPLQATNRRTGGTVTSEAGRWVSVDQITYVATR